MKEEAHHHLFPSVYPSVFLKGVYKMYVKIVIPYSPKMHRLKDAETLQNAKK